MSLQAKGRECDLTKIQEDIQSAGSQGYDARDCAAQTGRRCSPGRQFRSDHRGSDRCRFWNCVNDGIRGLKLSSETLKRRVYGLWK